MVTAGLEASYPIAAYTAGSPRSSSRSPSSSCARTRTSTAPSSTRTARAWSSIPPPCSSATSSRARDRIEGGTRANIGLRYGAEFVGGVSVDATVGQSFHLAGTNPYARETQLFDLANVGAQSGLETDRSDYVAGLAVSVREGFAASARLRLDESELDLRRAEAEASYAGVDFSAVAKYAFIDSQPDAERLSPRHQLHGAGRVRLGEHWSVNANATYDIEAESLWRRGVGLTYADECFAYTLDYSENRRNLDAIERSLQSTCPCGPSAISG